jgi:hypothetical protein
MATRTVVHDASSLAGPIVVDALPALLAGGEDLDGGIAPHAILVGKLLMHRGVNGAELDRACHATTHGG